jgi:hypothetical protein
VTAGTPAAEGGGALVTVTGTPSHPWIPTVDTLRAALEAFAARYGLPVAWNAWPAGTNDGDYEWNRIAVLPDDLETSRVSGALAVYPIGPDPDDDEDGDDAAALADALADDLVDRGFFVRGSLIPFEPLFVAVSWPAGR